MSSLALTLFPDLREPAPVRRSAVTNNPIRRRANQATAEGRRLADIYRGYLKAVGDLNLQKQEIAIEAAELTLACENMRARLLAGEDVANDLVRLTNTRDRKLEALGLDKAASAAATPTDDARAERERREQVLRDARARAVNKLGAEA
jgi:hypothetical protein